MHEVVVESLRLQHLTNHLMYLHLHRNTKNVFKYLSEYLYQI